MARNYYLPPDDTGKTILLEHLVRTLPPYLELLAIHPDEFAALQADALAMRYTLTARQTLDNHVRHWTGFRSLQRDGGKGDGAFPAALLLPPSVPAVPPGIIPRLTAFVARLKTARNYTTAIGHNLMIVGSQRRDTSAKWRPTLEISFEAGHPIIQWTKGDADSLELWADRGDGEDFTLVTVTTEPRYQDILPRAAALWQYKAIYRVGDERVGQWSNIASAAVGG